jgi:glycolate oxidase FAD binding subunit
VTPDTITIDGVGPMPLVRPASAAEVAEVAEVVRRAAAEGTAVYPVGGGTMLDYGLPPARPGLAVDLKALDKVIDFPARDMTITVEAGITIAKLDEIVRAEGLHLPIDVPEPERATLGGAIACNVSGPRRYGYGTFRDYVLGITTVNDRGELVSAGGRVVKNVAGYDLMKLHTGALGTLGIITQVTLRLKPAPEKVGVVSISFETKDLKKALECLHVTTTRPSWLFLSSTLMPGDDWPSPEDRWLWSFLAGFEGQSNTVAWQVSCLQKEFQQAKFSKCCVDLGETAPNWLPRIHRLVWFARFRASLEGSKVAEFCTLAGSFDEFTVINAVPEAGQVHFGLFDHSDWPLAKAIERLLTLSQCAASRRGNVVIERCPTEWKKSLPIWGLPPTDLALQKAVKRALDPKNILNPGRFITDAF